jgi:hypothetical protein
MFSAISGVVSVSALASEGLEAPGEKFVVLFYISMLAKARGTS